MQRWYWDLVHKAVDVEMQRLRCLAAETEHAVWQTLGMALNYPWYSDDPENFPDAQVRDGVCTGAHTAETPADEAAAEIRRLRQQLAEAQEGKREVEERLEALRQDQYRCWTCGGQDDPACACGGTGSHADEVKYMRGQCLALEAQLASARAALATAREQMGKP